jgi:hypothetical protein
MSEDIDCVELTDDLSGALLAQDTPLLGLRAVAPAFLAAQESKDASRRARVVAVLVARAGRIGG